MSQVKLQESVVDKVRSASEADVRLTYQELSSFSTEDWTSLMQDLSEPWANETARNEALWEEYETAKYEVSTDGSRVETKNPLLLDIVRSTAADIEAVRQVLRPLRAQQALVELAMESSQSGPDNMPPYFSIFEAVYDLDGNFLAHAKDTYYGGQVVRRLDGTRITYRASQASDPAVVRRNEAKKGYYTGTAGVPVAISYTRRKGAKRAPDAVAIRKFSHLIHVLENGL